MKRSDLDPLLVGEVVKRLCGAYNVTQRELADYVGTSPQSMTALVRGQVTSRVGTYLAVFRFFGLDKIYTVPGLALRDSVANYGEVELRAKSLRSTKASATLRA